MWAVTNQTRFKAERTFARGVDGAEIWIVAVRATFSIQADGTLVAAKEQEDVCLAPQYFGEPGKSSLRYDMDLVRTKPGTDIIVHAHAHAPEGQPVATLDVGWRVGEVSKSLRIVGDRVWEKRLFGLSPSEPVPFTTMPIRYERAWGGPKTNEPEAPREWSNPVGVGAIKAKGQPLPNCEPFDGATQPPGQRTPAGFGPVPCDWQQRVKLAGTYDDVWKETRQPLVPADFQDAYFRCAPKDQQCDGFLSGGEEVVLRNLSPEGVLSFQLPRVFLGFTTRIDGGRSHHRGQLHTVIIEPDDRRVMMVWQTSLPCHHTLYTLKETVVFEKEHLTSQSSDDSDT